MDVEKINGILNSKGVIGVSYKDKPIWIKNIQNDARTVDAIDLETDKTINIPISEIKEI
jgi:H-type small acid-soluble spore protein